jgi:hypothetical protein
MEDNMALSMQSKITLFEMCKILEPCLSEDAHKQASLIDSVTTSLTCSVDSVEVFIEHGTSVGVIPISLSQWLKLSTSDTKKMQMPVVKTLNGIIFSEALAEIAQHPLIMKEVLNPTTDKYEVKTNVPKLTLPKLTSPRVKLCDAQKLRQPVFGSSSESTYFAVALGNGINVAIRAKSCTQLSIRAEGTEISTYAEVLKEAGFDKAGDEHYSLHCNPQNTVSMKKVIGSLLYGTGIQFTETFLSLDELVGEGI